MNRSFGSGALRCALGLIAVGTGSVAIAAPATLAPTYDRGHVTQTRQVRFGDLDLSTDRGRATLDRRVGMAASAVCDDGNVTNTGTAFDYLSCYKAAKASARQQLTPRLAAMRGGGTTGVR